jgi:hypothetical protein
VSLLTLGLVEADLGSWCELLQKLTGLGTDRLARPGPLSFSLSLSLPFPRSLSPSLSLPLSSFFLFSTS